MEVKKPINIFNGLKSIANCENKINPKSNLIAIKSYQNSRNITKPFVKPISKII
jgi:flagellin-specific chaperone FliS